MKFINKINCFFGLHACNTVTVFDWYISKSACEFCGKEFLITEPPFTVRHGVADWNEEIEGLVRKMFPDKFKKSILVIAFIFLSTFAVNAQKVEVTQEFLADANRAFEEVVALRAEVKALKEARAADEAAIVQLKIELARMSGENGILKSQQIRDASLIEFFVKNTKKRKYGLINVF